MGRQRMIERRIKDGALVPAFDTPPMLGEIGYWLVTPQRPQTPAAQSFCEWLEETANA